MSELKKSDFRIFYGISFIFLVAVLYFLSKEQYWAAAFPLLAGIIIIALFSLDKLILSIAFFTPLAIVINDKSDGPAISLPTEPLLFGIMLIALFKLLHRNEIDKRIYRHPITIAIGCMMAWKLFTTITSTLPMVSLKNFIAQCWFVIPIYLLGTQLFINTKNINRFLWLYCFSLLIVIGYTLTQHAAHGWTQDAAHWVMYPFYNDHTAYAAAIAMFIPPAIAITRMKETLPLEKIWSSFVTLALFVAIVLSYTRAAWISLLIALVCSVVYFFKIKFWKVFLAGGALLSLFMVFQSDIVMKLEKNRQDSATDINKHLQSISNISTDASNLERINRWHSAMRMWRIHPFLGWGPGTYQFHYAPFQKSDEMTIISTNAGNRGNAHSEYIGPLAESGVLGMATMIMLLIVTIYSATIVYSRTPEGKIKGYILGILLGLITYFVHGTLNNFLDTDKLAVPFWAFLAMLVSLDVYHSRPAAIKKQPA